MAEVAYIGVSPGDLLTGGGRYRASWRRNTAALATSETVTLGAFDGSPSRLAGDLDAGLGPTKLFRASPLAWDADGRITWDLTAAGASALPVGYTIAQAADQLNRVSPYLTLDRLESRNIPTATTNREAERAQASNAASERQKAEVHWWDTLLGGLKAFGITTAVVALGGLAAYAYLTRRRDG